MQFARLRTHNGKAHVVRSFTVFGIKFQEKNGWYQVEDDVAEYLKTCVQVQEDQTSAKAFHVVSTLEEAEEIDDLEKRRAARSAAKEAAPVAKRVHQATARNTGDLTTKDLHKPAEGRRGKGFDEMASTFDDDMAPVAKTVTPALDGADEDEDLGATEVDEPETAEGGDTVVAPKPRATKPKTRAAR